MAFIKPLQDLAQPNLQDDYYRATVIDNQDPAGLKRVKIRIPELHGSNQEIPDSHLPWAISFRPSFLGGGPDLSSSAVPRVGSDLIVQHVKGDIYQPVYVFELYHGTNKSEKLSEDYPESYALQDSDGNYFHVNMNQDVLDILFNGSKFLEVTVDRTTTIGRDDSEIIGRNKTKIVEENETNTIKIDQTTTIENDRFIIVENNETRNVLNNQDNTIGVDRTLDIGQNDTETIGQKKEITSTRLVINTSQDVDINASANVTINGAQIHLNGAGGGVLTQESINPLTGTPYPDGSSTVKAGDG